MLTNCESCGAYLSVEGRTHCGPCAHDALVAKDAEIATLRAQISDANETARRLNAEVAARMEDNATLRAKVEALEALAPTALELAALTNAMEWSEKHFGNDNTKSITRRWLQRVEAARKEGSDGE